MLNSASLNYHQPELEEFVWFEDSPSGQEDKEQILINNFLDWKIKNLIGHHHLGAQKRANVNVTKILDNP